VQLRSDGDRREYTVRRAFRASWNSCWRASSRRSLAAFFVIRFLLLVCDIHSLSGFFDTRPVPAGPSGLRCRSFSPAPLKGMSGVTVRLGCRFQTVAAKFLAAIVGYYCGERSLYPFPFYRKEAVYLARPVTWGPSSYGAGGPLCFLNDSPRQSLECSAFWWPVGS